MRGGFLKHLRPKNLLLTFSLVGGAIIIGLLIFSISTNSFKSNPNKAKISKLEKINSIDGEGPDLGIVINDTLDQVSTNQNLNYSIDVSNVGNIVSTNVKVTINFSELPTYDLVNSTEGWACEGNTCIFNINSLDPSFTQNLNLAVSSPNSFGANSVDFITSANVIDDGVNGNDLDPTDNNSEDRDTIQAAPQMKLQTFTTRDSYVEGQKVVYRIEVFNLGNRFATNPIITTDIPDNTVYSITESTEGWDCAIIENPKACQLHLGEVEGFSSFVVYFAVDIIPTPQPMDPITQITNQMVVSNGDGLIDVNLPPVNPDPIITPINSPNLNFTKEFIPGNTSANQNVLIRYTLQNTGNANAYEIVIRDNSLPVSKFTNIQPSNIPEGFTFENHQADNNNVTLITSNSGTYIEPGQSAVFEFSSKLTDDFNDGDNFVSYSTATVSGLEGNIPGKRVIGPENTSATLIIGKPDLSVTITNSLDTVKPGRITNYIISSTNSGHSVSKNIKYTIVVPNYSTFIPANSSNWACSYLTAGGICTLNFEQLLPGESYAANFNLKIDVNIPQAVNTFANTVKVEDDNSNGSDIDLSNNTATDTDKIAKVFFP